MTNAVAQRFRIDPDVVARKVADEFILVPIRRQPDEMGYVYCLNSVGARIWELLGEERTVDDILQTILEEYDTDLSRGMSDLSQFLDELQRLRMIVPVEQMTGVVGERR